MLKIEIIAVGKFRRNGHFKSLWDDYAKQLQFPLKLIELDTQNSASEHKDILSKLSDQAYIIALDERGESLKSTAFSKLIEQKQDAGTPLIQFVLGGADGLNDAISQKSNKMMCFGKHTWPHMMARVMLIEQIYRAQQIMKGHPYHRD